MYICRERERIYRYHIYIYMYRSLNFYHSPSISLTLLRSPSLPL